MLCIIVEVATVLQVYSGGIFFILSMHCKSLNYNCTRALHFVYSSPAHADV